MIAVTSRTRTPRPASAVRDVWIIARRSLIQIPREPASLIPALLVPLFFYLVGLGALQGLTERSAGIDYRAFTLPVCCLFAVTGVSRGVHVVRDIQSGYFERLLMTPVARPALLLGLIVADIFLVVVLTSTILLLGLATGVRVQSGLAGFGVFLALVAGWSAAFAGYVYAVAFRTSSAAAVSACMGLFYPLAFLTSSLAPEETMTGWFRKVIAWNPVTYVLRGLREVLGGPPGSDVAVACFAIGLVGLVGQLLAYRALAGRTTRGIRR